MITETSCYYCGKTEKVIPQTRKLYDGRVVRQCVVCFKSMEGGLIIWENRKDDKNREWLRE